FEIGDRDIGRVDAVALAELELGFLACPVTNGEEYGARSTGAFEHAADSADNVRVVDAKPQEQDQPFGEFALRLLDAHYAGEDQPRFFACPIHAAADKANAVLDEIVFVPQVIVGPHNAFGGAGQVFELAAGVTSIAVACFLCVHQANLR